MILSWYRSQINDFGVLAATRLFGALVGGAHSSYSATKSFRAGLNVRVAAGKAGAF
jgi:hypothetical protein